MNQNNSGLVYIFTGDGKGKTSASLGVAVRALAAGLKVAVVQWYKDPAWKISDHQIDRLLTSDARNRFAIYPLGKGFHLPDHQKTAPLPNKQVVVDKASEAEHRAAAEVAYKKAVSLLNAVDVLVLDEINNAVSDSLIDEMDVTELIRQRGKTHLILTGRNASPSIVEQADLVTEMKKVKHPYDTGILAVRGLDY